MLIFKNNYKSFISVSHEWLNGKRKNVKLSTYTKYSILIEKYINSELYNKRFHSLKYKDLCDLFQKNSICSLSNTTKNNLLILINSIITYGIEKKYIKNFQKLNIKFKKEKAKICCFSKSEQKLLVKYLNNNLNLRNLLILIALYSGLRIGEICALKWKDIDFINNTLSVNKTVQRIKIFDNNSLSKTKLIIDNPKTKSSARIVPIPKSIGSILKSFKSNNEYFIFTNSENKPKDPRAVEKYFKNLLEKNNIKTLNFHSLRHTFATRLREQQVDIKVISELLGHSDWKTTQNIYIHASDDCKRDSINNLWKDTV